MDSRHACLGRVARGFGQVARTYRPDRQIDTAEDVRCDSGDRRPPDGRLSGRRGCLRTASRLPSRRRHRRARRLRPARRDDAPRRRVRRSSERPRKRQGGGRRRVGAGLSLDRRQPLGQGSPTEQRDQRPLLRVRWTLIAMASVGAAGAAPTEAGRYFFLTAKMPLPLVWVATAVWSQVPVLLVVASQPLEFGVPARYWSSL